MNRDLSDNIGELTPSPTLAIAAKAKELKNRGIDVVDLSAGEPDFDTPAYIQEAATRAMGRGETRYTAAAGILPLREAIAGKLLNENGLTYSPEQVVVTAGAKQAIFNAIFCLCGRGDEFIVPTPYWVSYPPMVAFAGATVRCARTSMDNGFRMTLADLEREVTPRTKGLILNSPNNPSGSVYSEDELREIWSFCHDRSIWIVSDEIYEYMIYDGLPFVSAAGVSEESRDNVVVVNGFSKSYSMTGWRIGYAAGPPDVMKAIESFQSHTTSNASSISQWAALAALEETGKSKEVHDTMMEAFSERRSCILEEVENTLGLSCVHPAGAFYIFADSSKFHGRAAGRHIIEDSVSLCRYLLEEVRVALVPGIAFGMEGYIRLSYAKSLDEIRKGMERLKKGLDDLSDRK